MRAGSWCCLFLIVMSSCKSEDTQNTEQDGSALVVYEASVENGIVGHYTDGKQKLYFETTRMAREVDESTGDERSYDIAIRISDENDKTLSVLTEGHDFPAEWTPELEIADADHATDPAIHALASKAAESLRQLKLDHSLQRAQELLSQQMEGIGQQEFPEFSADIDNQLAALTEKTRSATGISSADNSRTDALTTTWKTQYIDSYWKRAFYNGSPFDHTATVTYSYQWLGYWSYAYSTVRCNHGTCPLDRSMTWYTRHNGPVVLGLATPQMCSGVWMAPHLCNNDTALQQALVKNNYVSSPLSYCMFQMLWKPY